MNKNGLLCVKSIATLILVLGLVALTILENSGTFGKVDGDKMSDTYYNRYVKDENLTAYDALKILQKVVGLE